MLTVAAVTGLQLIEVMLIGFLVWWLRQSVSDVSRADAAVASGNQLRTQLEQARDAALASAKQATAERDEARAMANTLTTSLTAARQELTKHVRDKLATGTDADMAAEVDRLLGQQLPPVRPAGDPAGAGHGAPAAGAVPHP